VIASTCRSIDEISVGCQSIHATFGCCDSFNGREFYPMTKTTKSRGYDPKTKINRETTTVTRNNGSGYTKTEKFKMTGGGLFKSNVSRSRTDFDSPKKR
jgi:hypothetical protein